MLVRLFLYPMPNLEAWRLLQTPPLPGALNMAIDHTLLETYPLHPQPTLRFYRWKPASVSLGVAQRLARDVDQAACAELGIDVVRRPTGGRAILHDQEVTYALVIAVNHPLIGGSSVVEAYRAISTALCAGLAALGIAAELAPRAKRQQAQSAACFDRLSDYEITVGGRKLVGSAQARRHGVLLQHGTLLQHADLQRLSRVLRLPPALSEAQLAQRLVALDETLAEPPSFEAVVAALIGGLEQTWPVQLTPGALTHHEQQRAAELVRDVYANPAWTARR